MNVGSTLIVYLCVHIPAYSRSQIVLLHNRSNLFASCGLGILNFFKCYDVVFSRQPCIVPTGCYQAYAYVGVSVIQCESNAQVGQEENTDLAKPQTPNSKQRDLATLQSRKSCRTVSTRSLVALDSNGGSRCPSSLRTDTGILNRGNSGVNYW